MTQDELDTAIAHRAGLNIIKKGARGGAHEMAREALRLQREGWRPKPKSTPEMERAENILDVIDDAIDGIPSINERRSVATKVIADAIAQAVADAWVKVPANAEKWAQEIYAATKMKRPPLFDKGQVEAADYIMSQAEDGQ